MSWFECFIFSFTASLSFIAGIVSFRKNPRTRMKTSFSILACFLFIGNIALLVDSHLFGFKILNKPHLVSTFLVLFSFVILYFGLQFPTFFRNFTRLITISSFVFGLGVMLLLIDLGLLNDVYPEASLILLSYYYNVYYIITFLCFSYLVVAKLRYNFPAIKKFMEYIYYTTIILVFAFIGLSFFPNFIPLTAQYFLHFFLFIDFLYLGCFLVFAIQFSFKQSYLTHPFSFLFERTSKVFEDKHFAKASGARVLKEKLWRLYESRNWKQFMDSFWFQILVDETLDNALEHGGKREDDVITVHVFESKKFIDVYVIDSGKGFNPLKVPSPLETDRKLVSGGRGIHILKKLFLVRWNFLGNEINIRVDKSKSSEWRTVT
ncbi:ATP-binding protein [Leptospira sp. 96542]|nr:ATP-binding protein [Leptospira sp. 96542]